MKWDTLDVIFIAVSFFVIGLSLSFARGYSEGFTNGAYHAPKLIAAEALTQKTYESAMRLCTKAANVCEVYNGKP